MEWLNYHHLLYFWMAAREGSITAASAQLRLAQPTVSNQIRALEESLGEDLFRRTGRRLELTEMGHVVYRYAEEIFGLGRELMDTVRGRPTGRPVRFVVGVADVVPKMVARRLLEPALGLSEGVRIVCREGKPDRLLADLAVHALDLVLIDAPLAGNAPVRAFNHLLGECGVSFFAHPKLKAAMSGRFPGCLHQQPIFLPAENTELRRQIERWFETQNLQPLVAGEFEDSALMTAFGEGGRGVFPGSTVLEKEICKRHGVRLVGRTDAVREKFYAITVERRIKHPAAVAIAEAARNELFA